jgi:hypothetical protein
MPSPEAVVRMRWIWAMVKVTSLVANTARTSPSKVGVTVANGRWSCNAVSPTSTIVRVAQLLSAIFALGSRYLQWVELFEQLEQFVMVTLVGPAHRGLG